MGWIFLVWAMEQTGSRGTAPRPLMCAHHSPAYLSKPNEGPGQPMSLSGLGADGETTAFSRRAGVCCYCGRWQEEDATKAQLHTDH